jgi:hypothetical protein
MQRNAGALLLALALVMAACGSASKPLTEAQLRTRAGTVCHDVNRQILALQARATQATMHTSLAGVAGLLRDGIRRLHTLEPPQRLAARYASFIAWEGARRDAALELSKPGGTLRARSRRAVEAHHNPVTALSRQLGIPACP